MGQAKLRSAEIAMLKAQNGNVVRHITKHSWFDSIVDDGVIQLEGHNSWAIPEISRATIQKQFQIVGRFVWFTTERRAKCATGIISQFDEPKLCFEFNITDLQLEKWTDVYNSFTDPYAILTAKQMNDSARHVGDDPDKWYVSRVPVSLDKCINKHKFNELRVLAKSINKKFQQYCESMNRSQVVEIDLDAMLDQEIEIDQDTYDELMKVVA